MNAASVESLQGCFPLNDESRAWLLMQGHADLFLVNWEADQPAGPLYHTLTVSAGEAVFGLNASDFHHHRAALLCRPRPGAVLQPINPAEARVEWTNRWQQQLTENGGIDPRANDSSLRDFHRAALEAFVDKRAAEKRTEALRLQAKDRAQSATITHALNRFVSILSPEDESGSVRGAEEASGVIAACRIIARSLNLELLIPKGFVPSLDVLADASRLAVASSIRYRGVTLKAAWWKRDAGPLFALRATDSDWAPVALIRRGNAYYFYDPAVNSRSRVDIAVAATLAPNALMFYRPFPTRPLGVKDLLLFGLYGTWPDVAAMLAIGAITGALALALPAATGILFDTIIPGAQRPQLYQMAALLFAAQVTGFLLSLTSTVATQRMEGKMEAAIQSAVWDRLLSLPVRFFRDYTSGDLVTRSLAIGQIRQMLTSTALTSILGGIFSTFSFFLLFRYSVSLALVAAGLVFVAASASALCCWLQMKHQREIYQVAGKISGLTLELMTGIAKLRIAGAEPRAFAKWAAEFSHQKMLSAKAARVSIFMSIFNAIFPAVCATVIFHFGFRMMADGRALTPGSFVAFHAAFGQFLGATLGLAMTAISLMGIVPSYQRARPILQAVPEVQRERLDPGKLSGAIEVSRISFRYQQDTPLVLNDVSFEIKPGQFVALVGHSGSGKSTLFRLLLGFETQESGSIYFDGMDLADIDPQALRRQMGVVLQNGRIFDGDIYSNIVGASMLTPDDAWSAARAAGLDRDIESMPMGMYTVISEGGGGLSGGQRQRLMIARAVVNRPRILLFDEATSALDNQTQAIVSQSLERLQATRLVIAHRLSTIMNADQILVFDQGRIVQRGTYDSLMEQEGLFRQLSQRQLA